MNNYQDLTIIIPTLNEAGNIKTLLNLLLELYPAAKIIVSDDGSSDGTSEIVQTYAQQKPDQIKFLCRKNESVHGITVSVIAAVKEATTDFFAVIDGDLQHPPIVIKKLYEQIQGNYDLVAGARLPYIEKQAWYRIVATRLSTLCANLFLKNKGLDITDPMSGLFLSKTSLVKSIIKEHPQRFELAGYKILFDILKIAGNNLRTANVFYDFAVRGTGSSKLTVKHAWFFFRSFWK